MGRPQARSEISHGAQFRIAQPHGIVENRQRAAMTASMAHQRCDEEYLEEEEEEEVEVEDDGSLPLEALETEGLYRRGAQSSRRAVKHDGGTGSTGRGKSSEEGALGPLKLTAP